MSDQSFKDSLSGMQTRQSSTHEGKRALFANDGHVSPVHGLCAETYPGLAAPWWTLDLGAIFTFYGVILFVDEVMEPG